MTSSLCSKKAATFAMMSLILALCPLSVAAQGGGATVSVPLSEWRDLREPPPAQAALGVSSVNVTIEERGDGFVAIVEATIHASARTAGDIAIVLPLGTAVTATDPPTPLAPRAGGLAWQMGSSGGQDITVHYEADVRQGEWGSFVALPLPPAPAVALSVTLPYGASDGSIVPAVGLSSESGALSATVPGGTLAHIAWTSAPSDEEEEPQIVPSRATYRGELREDAISFEAELVVDLARDQIVPVSLFALDFALGEVRVDNEEAILRVVDDSMIAAMVGGRGRHTIRLRFVLPIDPETGLPSVTIPIPQIPVSRFEISMPEGRELRVDPVVAVSRERRQNRSVAIFNVPVVDQVMLEWPETIPEDDGELEEEEEVEARATATLVHVLRAEEGLLRGTVYASWDVTRGSSRRFALGIPEGVEIDSITTTVATVTDWRIASDRERTLTIILDRPVSGQVPFVVEYEVLLGGNTAQQPIAVPVLTARDAARQSGMLALLMTRETALAPEAEGIARVGENQLPQEVRAAIDLTVSHVFRWTEQPPPIRVAVTPRPREQARFDARVDALVSLGDATTGVSAAIDVNVKSGVLNELALELPPDVTVLEVSAPSLREHRVETAGDRSIVHLSFTQDMEGQLRIELRYERIVAADETEVTPPMAHVQGAEVEQGRVAVEATTAVEVGTRTADNLSPMDLNELPEELILRSENPILLAFRYARVSPTPSLVLSVTRHQEVELREVAIDEATYQTRVTDNGVAATTATWVVRNQREQFLRVTLPAGSEVVSARVGGRAETPATDSNDPSRILIGVLRSSDPFEVELTYETQISHLQPIGVLNLSLARPDVVATHARWEVYLPTTTRWSEPTSDLTLLEGGRVVTGAVAGSDSGGGGGIQIRVPMEGELWVFEGVYVGRGSSSISASFPYASPFGSVLGWLLGVLGAVLAWVGLLGLFMVNRGVVLVPDGVASYRFAATPRKVQVSRAGLGGLGASLVLGLVVIALAILWLGASWWAPLATSLVFVLGLLLAVRTHISRSFESLRDRVAGRPAEVVVAPAAPSAPSDPSSSAPDGGLPPPIPPSVTPPAVSAPAEASAAMGAAETPATTTADEPKKEEPPS